MTNWKETRHIGNGCRLRGNELGLEWSRHHVPRRIHCGKWEVSGSASKGWERQASQLMKSTEKLKFGFMSMSMTYFSSINMIKALRTVSAQDTQPARRLASTAGYSEEANVTAEMHEAKESERHCQQARSNGKAGISTPWHAHGMLMSESWDIS